MVPLIIIVLLHHRKKTLYLEDHNPQCACVCKRKRERERDIDLLQYKELNNVQSPPSVGNTCKKGG